MQDWGGWCGRVGMVLTWAVWMFGSALHYTYLPRCLSRSLIAVVDFAILQAALTGLVSWSMRRFWQASKQARQAEAGGVASAQNRSNLLVAGAAFAVAITMTNASVAYGSVSGSRLVKSLEPAIVAGLQMIAGITMNQRADLPWVLLLALAVTMMLVVAPTGITVLSAAAALVSTAGISTRNVFVKRHMLTVKVLEVQPSHGTLAAGDSATSAKQGTLLGTNTPVQSNSQDVQTNLNFVACGILITIASAWVATNGWGSVEVALRNHLHTSDLVIASLSFAAFQCAALRVLQHVSPTRQAAIKSLQNALTTAWTLLVDSNGMRHSSLEIVPALSWGICVIALATDAQMYVPSVGAPAAEPQCLPIFRLARSGLRKKGGEGSETYTYGSAGSSDDGGAVDNDQSDDESSRGRIDGTGSRRTARTKGRAWLLVYCSCFAAMVMQCAIMAARAHVVNLRIPPI